MSTLVLKILNHPTIELCGAMLVGFTQLALYAAGWVIGLVGFSYMILILSR